jgi:hypothetical protein
VGWAGLLRPNKWVGLQAFLGYGKATRLPVALYAWCATVAPGPLDFISLALRVHVHVPTTSLIWCGGEELRGVGGAVAVKTEKKWW